MRLINVTTLQLEWFADEEYAPPYAILSHTWGEGEVTVQAFMSPGREELPGWRKIELTCRQAELDKLDYTWVDTCCIDKTSSAELTEAINSMYEWYRKADVCYTFLLDLAPDDPIVEEDERGASKPSAAFAGSRWFTRGWTLQELIAPKTVRFYDSAWKLRGTKDSLAPLIATITGIEEPVLRGTTDISTLPIARRMAWAAGRTTTRAEDMAYCLLGIFDVNMPMMYGERRKAFIRLQEAIMHESNDTSLFAWQARPGGLAFRGMLAESPAEFGDAGGVEHGIDTRFDTEFSITNKGIKMNINTWKNAEGKQIFPLKCRLGGKPVAIALHQHGAGVYARATPNSLLVQSDHEEWTIQGVAVAYGQVPPVYFSKTVSPALALSLGQNHKHSIRLRKGFCFSDQLSTNKIEGQGKDSVKVTWVHPIDQWDSERRLFLTGGGGEFTGLAMPSGGDMDTTLLVVGIRGGKPWAEFVDLMFVATDKPGAMYDLGYLDRVAKEQGTSFAKGFQLGVASDVVNGEVVFCVDVTRASQEKGLASRPGRAGGRNRRLSN